MQEFKKKYFNVKYILQISFFAVVYYLTAKFGLSLAYDIKQVTLVWPPAGISLVTLLIFGSKYWPGITLGAFLANITSMEPMISATGISIGNTLETLFAFYVLKLLNFNKDFYRIKDVVIFILVAVILSPIIAAVIGTSSLIYGGIGSWNNFTNVAITWWAGDMIGIIIIVPAVLSWINFQKTEFNYKYFLESVLAILLIILTSIIVFTGYLSNTFSTHTFHFEYVILPMMLWISYKFRQKGSTLAILIVASIAIWGSINGNGPFIVDGFPEKSLLLLQSFIAIISLTYLVFSTIVNQRADFEKQIIDKDKRFKSLIENSSDAIILIDPLARIIYASPSVKRVLGYKPEELEGKIGLNLIYKDDLKLSLNTLKKMVTNPGKTFKLENRLVLKDKQVRWMEAEGVNLLADSAVNAIVINFRDIHDQKQLDIVKSEFVSLSAHQLRTPLSTIRWYVESLLKTKDKKTGSDSYLDEIYTAVLGMNETINLLLDVSKFEIGHIDESLTNVDLEETISEILESKDKEIKARSLKISESYSGKLNTIKGDPKLLKVVIENLISNAIKYTLTGGTIKIEIINNIDHVLLKVSDDGIGIPLEDQQMIFTKLFRSSNVKKIEPSGLGLGLYLVKLIVDLKGGEVWFKSIENKGTTFFVKLKK